MEKINRKEIKKNAHKFFRNNFFMSVLIIFLFSLIINDSYVKTTPLLEGNKDAQEIYETVKDKDKIENMTKEEQTEMNEKFNGVLYPIVKRMNIDKSPIVSFYYSGKLFMKKDFGAGFVSLLAALLSLITFFLLKLILEVGKDRFFLESRIYKKTNIFRLLYPYKSKDTLNISIILFFRRLYNTLWGFTIIGGPIKYYEYQMIPYILAENTSIKRKEAFNLSKEMMKGYKWQAFKLDMSLFGWWILGLGTLGISNILYYDAYKEYVYAELYYQIRKNKYKSLTNKKLLNDKYLFDEKTKLDEYPKEKSNIETRIIEINTNYDQKYSIRNLILLFFTVSFIGYSWEVLLHLIRDGQFVNRGTMLGPWLPIYGFGALIILGLLKPARKNPIVFFISAMILAGIVEYSTSWFLDTFAHMKWWDYTGYFLNINGRVCLEGLLVFGLGGSTITYFIGPMLNTLFSKIKFSISLIICILLVSLFTTDAVYSTQHPNTGEGITS